MSRTLIAIVLSLVTAVTIVQTQDKLDYAMFSKNPRRRTEPFAGPRPRQLAGGRLRTPAAGIAGDAAGRRLGGKDGHRLGARQRPSGEVAIRQRLVARAVQREHDRAAGPAAHRRAAVLDAGHNPGRSTADVVRVDIRSDADFDKYRGKLAGKIVLTQPARATSGCSRASSSSDGTMRS